jgi:sortase B
MSDKKNWIQRYWILAVLIAAAAGVLMYFGFHGGHSSSATAATSSASASASAETAGQSGLAVRGCNTYAECKKINSQYTGLLHFESGLINENVVQAQDNFTYLDKAWDLSPAESGAAFMDYRNSLDDQNIIIYGHDVYTDEALMFGPLHQLEEQGSYQANQYIDLELENETRRYQIAYVYDYEMNNDSLKYYLTEYEEAYLKTYLEAVQSKEFYSTGVSITSSDRWLTLQTCVQNEPDKRLIVLAKEIQQQ